MLQNSTFQFLKALAKNNNREWFALHKPTYEIAKLDVIAFAEKIFQASAAFDPNYKNLLAPKCVMRIYRDVRFSKNKAPYKTNFGIAYSSEGKLVGGTGCFIHIQPGASFVAGGYYLPSSEDLKKIRQEIDYNLAEFEAIIQASAFKKQFGSLSIEDKLKTAPREYPKDHIAIELLKLKSFIGIKPLSDELMCSGQAIKEIVAANKAIAPLRAFLANAIKA
jgi:uncharacterized protein (TIGR02453 family)